MSRVFACLLVWACLLSPAFAQTSSYLSFPTTPVNLTDGPTITVPCPGDNTATYYLTLTGNNHQIAFPSCPARSNGLSVQFRINAGNNAGSPFTGLTFASGYNWTNKNPYAICTAVSTPNPACMAAENVSQVDWFGCDAVGTTASSTEWDCWTPQYNVAAPASGFQQLASASCASPGSGAACTTSTTNMSGVDLIVGCIGYYTGTSGVSNISDSQGNVYTQVYSTQNAQNDLQGVMVYVQNPSVSSSMTFTASATGASAYPGLTLLGFSGSVASPLDQTHNAININAVTSMQPGSITPSQANELLVACLALGSNSDTITSYAINSGFTTGPQVTSSTTAEGSAIAYLVQTSAVAENPTWTWTNTGFPVAGQASFK